MKNVELLRRIKRMILEVNVTTSKKRMRMGLGLGLRKMMKMSIKMQRMSTLENMIHLLILWILQIGE